MFVGLNYPLLAYRMCGIFGYAGTLDTNTLINGLLKLEYRGYDSAGIAIIKDGKIILSKSVGKVSELSKQALPLLKDTQFSIGIAHTRWATHGNPTELNAHPHHTIEGSLALVHNGIIDNYKTLKRELELKGYTFYSETDSEIIVKLIDSNYKEDLKQAVLDSLPHLNGSYSIAVISEKEPDRIIAVRNGCSLILGIAPNSIILSSDLSAIVEHTNQAIYLDDGDVVDINQGTLRITNFSSETLLRLPVTIEWTTEQASKSGYEHYLLKEIMEQPESTASTVRNRVPTIKELPIKLAGLENVSDKLKVINRIVLLGIGTSFYSCKLGELYFEELTGIPCIAYMTPEFRLKSNTLNNKTWVIAVSQSGETFDTIQAILKAKQSGALVTGIVNVVGSTISRITDAGVYNQIGPEISVASTKAFSSQALLLLLHALYLNQINSNYTPNYDLVDAITKLPSQIQETLENANNVEKLSQRFHNVNDIYFLGLKYNYPIALEGALKLKEISPNIHAEALSAGELKHGFIAMIDENRPTIAINPSDSVNSKTSNAIEQVKARNGTVITLLTSQDDADNNSIIIPQTSELLQPILCNIVLQLFAYYCSVLNGYDVDRPRNLAKSVTVE